MAMPEERRRGIERRAAVGVYPAIESAGLSWGGVWSGLLIALFVGGVVAARTGSVRYQSTAYIHGALVWVLAMLGILYLAGSGISLGAGALFDVAGGCRARRRGRRRDGRREPRGPVGRRRAADPDTAQ